MQRLKDAITYPYAETARGDPLRLDDRRRQAHQLDSVR